MRPAAYRADIDGLRAVAVLAVVAFHAAPAHLPGGFAGVDVFFVISGYLITGLLLDDPQPLKPRLRAFYARRVRRIFPALLVVLAGALAAGWYLLLPGEWTDLGRHAAAASAFVVNIVFWREANYFDPRLESSPLLHLWSLSVEEQFYLLWPLLLALVVRGRARWWIASVVLASFALGVALVARHGEAAFFLLPPRAWELLAGALLAWRADSDAGLRPVVRNALSIAGIVLIVAAFVSIDRTRLFPGGWALLPVAGTCCMIAAGPDAWVQRNLLARRFVVAVGLVSYPLYLWHWLALSLVRTVEAGYQSDAQVAAALAVSSLLAIATYLWIERPLRARSVRVAIPLLAVAAILGAVSLAVMAGVLHPRIDRPELQRFDAARNDWQFPSSSMRRETVANGLPVEVIGHGSRRILFLGDSNMQQYAPRIDALVNGPSRPEVTAIFATAGSCPPVFGAIADIRAGCADFSQRALDLARDASIATVVLAAQWPGYVHPAGSGPQPDELRIGDKAWTEALEAFGARLASLRTTSKQVYVLLDIPAAIELDPRFVLHRRWSGGIELRDAGIDRTVLERRQAPVLVPLAQVAGAAGAVVIDPVKALCSATRCPSVDSDGEPLYRDGYHLRASFVRDRVHYLDAIVAGR